MRITKIILVSIFLIAIAGPVVAETYKIPSGLSDTATERAWDEALEKARRNDYIEYEAAYDTPTPEQLFEYLTNFSNYSDTTVSDTTAYDTMAEIDTRTIYRVDLEHELDIVEVYNSAHKLVDYKKLVDPLEH